MKVLHQAALDDASKQRLEAKELRGLLAKCDDACLELSRVKSRHSEEMETVKKQFSENLGRQRREAAEERNRLSRMLGELEEKVRRRDRDIADRDDNIKWHQEKLIQLDSKLSQAWGEVDDRQSRINDLKSRIELARADKLRAIDEAKELTKKLARQEEEMKKAELENQDQMRALRGELASSRGRSSELERRVSETEEQIALLQSQVAETEGQVVLLRNQVAETEMRLALLRGEQDATCADAFQLGSEDTRSKISKEHPEWDLSFLDAETSEVCTPGDDEDEYVDLSDADLDTALGASEAAVPGGPSQPVAKEVKTFEKGETSHASPNVAEEAVEAAGAAPNPDS